MLIGLPKGLMYWKYGITVRTFLEELGLEYIVSPDTNRDILDRGVNTCVDDACLPVKVFHGHVDWLKDRCDLIITPRIMKVTEREFICPKFCGIIEMLKNSITGLPKLTEMPLNMVTREDLLRWFMSIGKSMGCNRKSILQAYEKAIGAYRDMEKGYDDSGYEYKVALIGHPYNIYDDYCNMNLRRKLNRLGVGVITEEKVDKSVIEEKVTSLFKRPFWSFAKNSYGASIALYEQGTIDGIIYISSFACGIDSIVIEIIKDYIGDFPFMVLKIDEHTGEAGVDTRIEAFCDMLERRNLNEDKCSESGKHLHSC
ncbi:MAG: acyl-CoA dehydratase activase-related protein [Bacillota bacterium]|nr:acyl-CoA dehydratase activase-related protein [Bacillota bacterium]